MCTVHTIPSSTSRPHIYTHYWNRKHSFIITCITITLYTNVIINLVRCPSSLSYSPSSCAHTFDFDINCIYSFHLCILLARYNFWPYIIYIYLCVFVCVFLSVIFSRSHFRVCVCQFLLYLQNVLQRIRAADGVSTPWHGLHAARGPVKHIVEYDDNDARDQCKYRPFTTTAVTKTVLFLLVLLLFVFMVSIYFFYLSLPIFLLIFHVFFLLLHPTSSYHYYE